MSNYLIGVLNISKLHQQKAEVKFIYYSSGTPIVTLRREGSTWQVNFKICSLNFSR